MTTEEAGLRETILKAAKSLFIMHGYHGLSMREIAEKVGVSKAALYYHFKDKEELFIAVLDHSLEELGSVIDAIGGKPVSYSEKVAQFIDYVLSQPAEQRAMIRLGTQEISQLSETSRKMFDVTYHNRFTGKLKELFQNGMKAGDFRDLDPDIATWALMGLLYPYLYPKHFGFTPLGPEKIQMIIGIFMDGVKQNQKNRPTHNDPVTLA